MIEQFNNWMEKVGADKLLHFFLTAWVVAEAKVFGFIPMVVAFFAVLALGVVKERLLDEEPDHLDWLWSLGGGIVSMLIWWLI